LHRIYASVRLRFISAVFGLLLSLTAYATASTPEINWQQGTLQAIDEHANGRIVYWENKGKVPIYDGYPFYDLTIRRSNTDYVVRYEGLGDYFPTAWQVGSPIKIKIKGSRMYLLEYDDSQASVRILRQSKARR
jgi:hypothetical protein